TRAPYGIGAENWDCSLSFSTSAYLSFRCIEPLDHHGRMEEWKRVKPPRKASGTLGRRVLRCSALLVAFQAVGNGLVAQKRATNPKIPSLTPKFFFHTPPCSVSKFALIFPPPPRGRFLCFPSFSNLFKEFDLAPCAFWPPI